MRKNILNNMAMENHRKNPVYQTLVTDLFNAKVIDQDLAERLLGYEVPDYLVLPEEPEIIREEKNTTPATDGKSDDGKSDDGKSDDGKSDDGKSDDGKSDDGKSDDGKSDDSKSDDGKSDDGKSDDGKSDDGKSDDGKSDDGKSDDGKSDDGRDHVDDKEKKGFFGFGK